MKYLLTILLCTSYICSYSQDIPKNAETIVIKGVSFLDMCNRLLDSGYVIATKDNDLQTVTTVKKEYPRYWNGTYYITIRVKDSAAMLKVLYEMPLGNGTGFYLVNKKGKPQLKSNVTVPWLEGYKIANSFGLPLEFLIAKD